MVFAAFYVLLPVFLLQFCFSLTSKTPPCARFSHSSRCCARRRRGLCLIFALFKKTRLSVARDSVVLFWLRLGPKLEKRGLRGEFLTLGNHVFCDSPLGAFCVFLSVPFSVICSGCSLGGWGGGGGLNDVLFRGQAYAAIRNLIKSITRGNEHATNETCPPFETTRSLDTCQNWA